MTEAAGKLWLQSRLQAQTEKPSVGPAGLALGVDSTPSSVLMQSQLWGSWVSHSLLPRCRLNQMQRTPPGE